jgi:hypothetical protein
MRHVRQDGRRENSGSKEAAKEYGLSVFKGLVGAIPFAGTAINEILFEARSRLKQQRVNDFVAAVAEDVKALQSESIKQDFLATEEFSDLIEDIFIRVRRTKSAERRNHYKSILVRAFQGLRDPDFSTFFLNVLEEITEPEVTILRGFAKYLAAKPEYDKRGEACSPYSRLRMFPSTATRSLAGTYGPSSPNQASVSIAVSMAADAPSREIGRYLVSSSWVPRCMILFRVS